MRRVLSNHQIDEYRIKRTPSVPISPNQPRRWLAEAWKTAKKQPITSSSMPSSSTEAKGQSTESQERLAIFISLNNDSFVLILNPGCSGVEIQHHFPVNGQVSAIAFQNKLVFISGGSRRVDLMDLSTGQVSSLPDMINARRFPVGVGNENEIFVFGTWMSSDSTECLSNEVYEDASGRRPLCHLMVLRAKELLPPSRWSILPPMIEKRSRCAAVNIPDYGILVIGGIGRNGLHLRSTELLTRRSGEVGGGEGEKWQWLPYTSMNKEHRGNPLAVYFQGRVYVVGYGEIVKEMEMLDVAAGGQWTPLTFSRQRQYLSIQSMAIVGNELFVTS
ncbi:unnamed protein product [Hymenolepis diminuta]|uniref:F-box/kelch-repeat protein n=1 Tax=Hymenolepis diminuta TaxID=6216 RepID=A0A158QFH6_HYMDI|nr:unnamed protein product [Hymenolepis diminuta]